MSRPQYAGPPPEWGNVVAHEKAHVSYYDDDLVSNTWRTFKGVDGLGQGYFDVLSSNSNRNRTGAAGLPGG